MQKHTLLKQNGIYFSVAAICLPFLFLIIFLVDTFWLNGYTQMTFLSLSLFLFLPCSIAGLVLLKGNNIYKMNETRYEILRGVIIFVGGFGVLAGIFGWMFLFVLTA